MKTLFLTFLLLFSFATPAKQKLSDAELMKAARSFYAQKKYHAALKNYEKVNATSDYWLEAIEESAWSYIQLGNLNKGLARIKMALPLSFTPQLRPEVFLVLGYIHYQTCNYFGTFKLVQKFKNRFLSRSIELQKLAKKQPTESFKKALAIYSKKDLLWKYLSNDVHFLPRMFHKDKFLIKQFALKRTLPQDSSTHVDQAILRRMAQLAKIDLKEMSVVTKKLHLIEGDATQRTHSTPKAIQASKVKTQSHPDVLIFPNEKEIWLDEIKHIRASHGQCPNLKKGAL